MHHRNKLQSSSKPTSPIIIVRGALKTDLLFVAFGSKPNGFSIKVKIKPYIDKRDFYDSQIAFVDKSKLLKKEKSLTPFYGIYAGNKNGPAIRQSHSSKYIMLVR